MKYIYIVSYFHRPDDNGSFGFGRQEITLDEPITRGDQFKEIERRLSEFGDVGKAIVISHQLLRTEEA